MELIVSRHFKFDFNLTSANKIELNQTIFSFHIVTRMTSISNEARRNQTSILIRGRENHVSPKPDRRTDRQTYGRTVGHTHGRTLVFIEKLRY